MRIFFSYSWKDRFFVRKLTDLLPEAIRPWVDENELHAGQPIKDELRAAIKKSDFVVAILSRDSICSGWVDFELKTAMEKESTKNRILPIVIDDNISIPDFIRGRKCLYLRDRSQGQINKISEQLLESIVNFVIEGDSVTSLFREQPDVFRNVIPAKFGEPAPTIGPKLHDLLLKKIQAIYQKMYSGIKTKEHPPEWLMKSMSTSADLLRSHASAEQARLLDRHGNLINQCFLIGYYAMFLRRSIVGIEVDDGEEYDANEVPKVFGEMVQHLHLQIVKYPRSGVDKAIRNLGVRWVGAICDALIEKGILPNERVFCQIMKRRKQKNILVKSMFHGMAMSRAVEWIARPKNAWFWQR